MAQTEISVTMQENVFLIPKVFFLIIPIIFFNYSIQCRKKTLTLHSASRIIYYISV